MSKKESGFDPSRRGFLQGAAVVPVAAAVGPAAIAATSPLLERISTLLASAGKNWSINDLLLEITHSIHAAYQNVAEEITPNMDREDLITNTQTMLCMLEELHAKPERLRGLAEALSSSDLSYRDFLKEAEEAFAKLGTRMPFSKQTLESAIKQGTNPSMADVVLRLEGLCQQHYDATVTNIGRLSSNQLYQVACSGRVEQAVFDARRSLGTENKHLIPQVLRNTSYLQQTAQDAFSRFYRFPIDRNTKQAALLANDVYNGIIQSLERGESPETIQKRVTLFGEALTSSADPSKGQFDARYFDLPIDHLDELHHQDMATRAALPQQAHDSDTDNALQLYRAREHLNQELSVELLPGPHRYRIRPQTAIPISTVRQKLRWIIGEGTRMHLDQGGHTPSLIVQTTDATTIALLEGMASAVGNTK